MNALLESDGSHVLSDGRIRKNQIWLQKDDGTFQHDTGNAITTGDVVPYDVVGHNNAQFKYEARHALFGDLNGDGNLDVVISLAAQVFFGDGQGSYTYQGHNGILARANNGQYMRDNPSGMALGDVDNDGDLDIVACYFWNSGPGTYLYLNDGNGVFSRQLQSESGLRQVGNGGEAVVDVALADLDAGARRVLNLLSCR